MGCAGGWCGHEGGQRALARWAAPAARTHTRDGQTDSQNDRVPLRPKQRANPRGPLCMGARVDARTIPYKTGPPPARSGPGNVCTHDCRPVEAGGSMWKARAGSPPVAWEPSRLPFLPCQTGRLAVTGGAQVPSVGPRFRNGGGRPSQPWFLLCAAGASAFGRVVQAVNGVRSVQ